MQLATKINTEFMAWWKQLNAELDKLHPGQQAGFRDARDSYDMGQSPETAAAELMAQWSDR
jgi:hypothetical protein